MTGLVLSTQVSISLETSFWYISVNLRTKQYIRHCWDNLCCQDAVLDSGLRNIKLLAYIKADKLLTNPAFSASHCNVSNDMLTFSTCLSLLHYGTHALRFSHYMMALISFLHWFPAFCTDPFLSFHQAHVYYKHSNDCVAFLANYDSGSNANVTFNGNTYFLPAWSVSILADCKNVIFNTAKVLIERL